MRSTTWLGITVALLALLGTAQPAAAATTQAEIDAALVAGRPVFLVVTDRDAKGTDRALEAAKGAVALAPKAAVVVLDRGAAENAALVKKYRLLGAPVPLVLVVASNGVVAGGALLKDATPKAVASLVPSPKKADFLLALQMKRAVFVVVSRATMPQRSDVFGVCSAAFKRMETTKQKAQVVTVDLDDKAEAKFLKELNASPKLKAPVVFVFNAKGQKTAAYRADVKVVNLVTAAKKKAACCPGGDC